MAISDKPNTSQRGFTVRALGEVAIRCDALPAMVHFYEHILGLERLQGNTSPDIVFFRIAPGFGGHTTVLALFDKSLAFGDAGGNPDAPVTGPQSALHHLAFTVPHDEQDAAMRWYEANGLAYRVEHFPWIGWRGIFTQDPEGNTVELVARLPET